MEISEVFKLALASFCFWYTVILCIQALSLDIAKVMVYGSALCWYACLVALYYFIPTIRDVFLISYILGASSLIILLLFYYRDICALLYVHISGILYFAMTHTASFVETLILFSLRADVLAFLGDNVKFIYDIDFTSLLMVFSSINFLFLVLGAFRQGKHKFAIDVTSFPNKILLLGAVFALVSIVVLLTYYQVTAMPLLVTIALKVDVAMIPLFCLVGISLILMLAYAMFHKVSYELENKATALPIMQSTKVSMQTPSLPVVSIHEKVEDILFHPLPFQEEQRYSEHDALHTLCYAYTNECQNLSIPLYTQIVVDRQIPFDDQDICVLLALCIELGIEGCQALPNDMLRFINIYVKQNNEAIEIIADYPPKVNINQIFPHQNRMQQVMQIVKRYEGGLKFDNSKEYASIFITMYENTDDMTGNFSNNLV